jgi:hypothetical protein
MTSKIYIAEVRDLKDPLKSGRCKLRIYGRHDDEQTAGDEDAFWGMPMMPSTSASTGRSGVIPTGMQVGSRVIITFAENDVNEKSPIILGSFYRGGSGKKTSEE